MRVSLSQKLILGSLAVCTLLYLAVAAVVTGMVPLAQIDKTAPLATAFRDVGLGFASGLISAGAIVGLTSVLLVLLLGQSRIFLAMARDGLMPAAFGRIHPRFRTPHVSTILVGVIVAVLSGLTPLAVLVELVSIGTLFAFVLVSAGVLVLRRTPEMLAQIASMKDHWRDDGTTIDPPYVDVNNRSIKPEFLVVRGVYTRLGCVPQKRADEGKASSILVQGYPALCPSQVRTTRKPSLSYNRRARAFPASTTVQACGPMRLTPQRSNCRPMPRP